MSLISPAPKTPLTPAQALYVLQEVLPAGTSRTALDMIAAQSAVETARWTEMFGWNFGNVTPSASQLAAGADYFSHANTGTMKYLAFDNPVAGGAAMVAWLTSHGLLTPAENGDLAGYMAALQAGSYLGTVGLTDGSGHTVSQSDYTNYQNDIASIMGTLASVTPEPPPGGWEEWAGWIGALSVAAIGLGAWQWERVGPLLRRGWEWLA
jgi:hypothetical protein